MAHSKKQVVRQSKKGKARAQIIALLTDFGSQDQYVAAMKGVILSINPAAQIVDVTHEVQPQRPRQAGYLLWSVYKYFPKGTTFVNIVDPEVGSKRRIIGIRTSRHTFLAPDNGLLDFILNEEKVIEIIEVLEKDTKEYVLDEISATFHGRDIFAPIAAHLSKGIPLKRLGDSLESLPASPQFVHSQAETKHASILHIDRFGNIITNLEMSDAMQVGEIVKAISVGKNTISHLANYYAEAPANTPCLLLGSNGLVEIAVKNKSAAHLLNVTLDTPVTVYWQ